LQARTQVAQRLVGKMVQDDVVAEPSLRCERAVNMAGFATIEGCFDEPEKIT
jgi:hypothetical protein